MSLKIVIELTLATATRITDVTVVTRITIMDITITASKITSSGRRRGW